MKTKHFFSAAFLVGCCNFLYAQNVGIGTTNPVFSKLVVQDNNALVITATNSTTLGVNTRTGIALKNGNYFTGGIYTTGTNSAFARMGLYTYASLGANELRERLTITDSGFVGINDTFPQVLTTINGNTLPTAKRLVVISNAVLVANGDVGHPALRVNDDAVFSQSYVQIDETSRLGIGVDPSYPLDISVSSGSIRIRDGNQGAGKVLTSDANGIAGWAASPAARSAKGVLTLDKSMPSGTASSIGVVYNAGGGFMDITGNTNSGGSMTVAAGQAGTYLVQAQVTWRINTSFSATKYFRMNIRKNGTEISGHTLLTSFDNVSDIDRTQYTATVIKLAANDIVSISAAQESGQTQTILAGENHTFITLTRLY